MPIKKDRLERAKKRLLEEASASGDSSAAYIREKLRQARAAALEKSRTRTEPAVPYVKADVDDDLEMFRSYKKQAVQEAANYLSKHAILGSDMGVVNYPFGYDYGAADKYHSPESVEDSYEYWRNDYQNTDNLIDETKAREGTMQPGLTCIFTATDNYGNKYRVPGNQTFFNNPEKYGFIQIPFSEAEAGDIVQDAAGGMQPFHAMVIDSIDDSGNYRYNYSRGGVNPEDIVHGGKYHPKDDEEGSRNAFRFVGTPADSLRWRTEYENSRKNGGPLRQFYAGGDTEPNKWDRISNARYKMANSALLRGGEKKVDADRLARFLAAQSALEAGWVDDVRGHNYAGYMSNGKRMTFDNADSFWDYHLKNMDEKWPGWRQADSIDAYYNIINHPELGLDTKEKYDAYNKKHHDAPVYLYAPAWENENYLGKLRGVYNKYINRYVTPMACGGKMHKYDGDSEPSQEVRRGGVIGSLLRSLGDSGVRDAKIGAVGAQQVRDLYASGQDELASKLANAYKDAAVIGIVNAATAGVLPYADALATTRAGKAATHALKTLAKPANALSDQGASLATLADALGFVSGVSGLANDAENAIHGNYNWSDVPETLLDATVFVPGASQITDARNLDNLAEAGKTLANIPNITSRNTFLNRVFHPVETYRFSDLSRKAKDVLPDDVYEQALSDLSNAYLYNAPNLLPGAQPGYSFLDRSPSLGQMYYYRDPNTGYIEIAALGDEMAKNDFSRGHELGHLVADSAESLGYEIGNYPKSEYNYNGAADTEQVIGENFADIFGNSITRDAHTDIAPGFMKKRYPYIQGEKPVLNKTKTERKPLTIDDIPDSSAKRGLLGDMQNLQKAIDLNEDKSIIEYYERRVKMWKDKLGLK